MVKEYQLNPKDIFIIDDEKIKLFFHAESLQMYPISNIELFEFLKTFSINGYKTTREKYSIDDFNQLYEFVVDKINNAPKSISQDDKVEIPIEFKSAILPISANCNLNCPYCFAQTDGGFHFINYTEDDSIRIIDFLMDKNKYNSYAINIIFFGGEPLLNLNNIKFTISYIQKKYPDKKVNYSITTNGTILTEEIIELLKKHNFGVLISIDGPDNEFNLRLYKDGSSSINKVINNIQILKDNQIEIQLRATLTNNNNKIVETFDFFENLDIPFTIVFAYASENKSHSFANYSPDTLNNISKSLNELLDYYIEKVKAGKYINNEYIYEVFKKLRYRIKQKFACSAGQNLFTISADGTIFTCAHLMNNKKYAIGSTSNGLNDTSTYLPVSVDKIEDCSLCWAKYLCAGGCISQKISTGYSNNTAKNPISCDLDKLQWEMCIKLFYHISIMVPNFLSGKEKESKKNNC